MSLKTPNREGPRHRYQDQVFWAWNGMIAVEDQRTGDFKTMAPAEFFARALCFNDDVKRGWDLFYDDERTQLSRAVMEMCECVKEAGAQGDPTIPGVTRQVALENNTIKRHIARPGSPVYFLPQQDGAEILKSNAFKKMTI